METLKMEMKKLQDEIGTLRSHSGRTVNVKHVERRDGSLVRERNHQHNNIIVRQSHDNGNKNTTLGRVARRRPRTPPPHTVTAVGNSNPVRRTRRIRVHSLPGYTIF
jgi:hypothetical protein